MCVSAQGNTIGVHVVFMYGRNVQEVVWLPMGSSESWPASSVIPMETPVNQCLLCITLASLDVCLTS